MTSVANFLFEAGMLRRTPRSGYQFLGSGRETVAEHTSRTAFVGFALAELCPGADRNKVVTLCLFHDFLEARTGDHNYMNKKYVETNEEKALSDAVEGLPFADSVREIFSELWGKDTEESRLAKDADVIDLILSLKEEQDLGNPYAGEWIGHALKRLATAAGRELASKIIETDSTQWWFDRESSWWSRG